MGFYVMIQTKPVCGARTRKGSPCQCKKLFKSGRCKFHGGMSAGPITVEGKSAIAAAQRQRWTAWPNAKTISVEQRGGKTTVFITVGND